VTSFTAFPQSIYVLTFYRPAKRLIATIVQSLSVIVIKSSKRRSFMMLFAGLGVSVLTYFITTTTVAASPMCVHVPLRDYEICAEEIDQLWHAH
jgi:hypothetical protein